MENDTYYMKMALKQAVKAFNKNEIPVGAVIVENGKIISQAYNKKESTGIVTEHAELIAIEKANKAKQNWRLNDCTIYVTLEPCPMCASAIQQSRIKKIVYGCSSNDTKNSQIISKIISENYNHKVELVGGILEKECSSIIKKFFASKR